MKLYKALGLVSLFPIWAFRANLNIPELLFVNIIFFTIPLLAHFYYFGNLKKKYQKNSLFLSAYLSFLIVFCLDQNLGLWTTSLKISGTVLSVIKLHFYSPFVEASGFLFVLYLIFFAVIRKSNKNSLQIIFVFLLSITLFNLFDYRKNLSSFPKINLKAEIKNNKMQPAKKNLVIILDEMSGINSEDSSHYSGTKVQNKLIKTFKNNDFEVFVNAKTLYNSTKKSIPSILNYIASDKEYVNMDYDSNERFKLLKKSNNYFVTHELTKNKFFDNLEFNNIIVFQSMFIDFCKHEKVINCYQYNPFDRNKYFLKYFRNSYLTLIISAFKNNGSIIGNISWRMARYLDLSDSLLDPEGEKASFVNILDKISFSLVSKKSDLVFAHILVPHVPYGFDDNCNYKGFRGARTFLMTIDEKKVQHNLERKCVAIYLSDFFSELKSKHKEIWQNLEITILSDHDSRIPNADSPNTAMFVHKYVNGAGKIKIQSKTTNQIFKEIFNK